MIAVDTNILARWILRDDPDQLAIARRLLSQPCWVNWTVLLELVWLLGSRGGLKREEIAVILQALLQMPTLTFDRPANLQWAVERYRKGADIADMFHIASTDKVESFVSFEKSLRHKAGTRSPVPIALAK